MPACNIDAFRLRTIGPYRDTQIYELQGPEFSNRYYILSYPDSRALMGYPEVVSFASRHSLLMPTEDAFRFLQEWGMEGSLEILTILRGGLNYPLDEACWKAGIKVSDNHFLSCERIIEEHVIKGLEIKYEKIRPGRSGTSWRRGTRSASAWTSSSGCIPRQAAASGAWSFSRSAARGPCP